MKFPEPQFHIKNENGKPYIFDAIRKKWLLLTEEEWVRQNFIAYLVKELSYPSSLIALEKEIELNGRKKRFDILIYDREHNPWMLVECKATEINLSEDVLQQVLRYNVSVPVQFVVITNGKNTVAWEKENAALHALNVMPRWSSD